MSAPAYGLDYQWSVAQIEFARDVIFRRRARLHELFERAVEISVAVDGKRHVLRPREHQPAQRELRPESALQGRATAKEPRVDVWTVWTRHSVVRAIQRLILAVPRHLTGRANRRSSGWLKTW